MVTVRDVHFLILHGSHNVHNAFHFTPRMRELLLSGLFGINCHMAGPVMVEKTKKKMKEKKTHWDES